MSQWLGPAVSTLLVATLGIVALRENRRAEARKTNAESGEIGAKTVDTVIEAADKVIKKYQERDDELMARIELAEGRMRAMALHIVHLEQTMRDSGMVPPPRPENWPWNL